jgi:fatty acid desaturase
LQEDKKENKKSKDIEKLKDDISLEESENAKKRYLQVIILFLAAGVIIALGIFLRWDKWIVGLGVFLFGLVSQGWSSLF